MLTFASGNSTTQFINYKIMKYYKITWKYKGRKYSIIEGFPKEMNIIDCWSFFFEHTSKTCYSGRTVFDFCPLKSVTVIK